MSTIFYYTSKPHLVQIYTFEKTKVEGKKV